MAELSIIARPYAQAVFELAKAGGDYAVWSDELGVLASISAHEDVMALFSNPRVSRQQVADALIDICRDGISNERRNLVRLLAQNRRLPALPAIAAQYEKLRADAERTIKAELETALPVSEEEQGRIAQALKDRLGREVELQVRMNPDLIGGAVIRAGDLVIDGSMRARLDKLATQLGT